MSWMSAVLFTFIGNDHPEMAEPHVGWMRLSWHESTKYFSDFFNYSFNYKVMTHRTFSVVCVSLMKEWMNLLIKVLVSPEFFVWKWKSRHTYRAYYLCSLITAWYVHGLHYNSHIYTVHSMIIQLQVRERSHIFLHCILQTLGAALSFSHQNIQIET